MIKLSDFCDEEEIILIKFICKLFNAQSVKVIENQSER
jgi:hypothetical protein